MKKMNKSVSTLCLALALAVGANTVTTKKAEAGIIIGAFTAGVGTALIGLGVSAAGFFWGIQSDDLNWKAGALFILDHEVESSKLNAILSKKYPELESYLVEEITELAINNSNLVEFNAQGLKEVLIPESELEPVLEVLSLTNPSLAKTIKADLTKSSL